ncbi:isoleucine--tRNA ligase [Patescibacteria group bacterium]|nr:isoleucine--tRNA ligase [Patescibacteria group bacterium]
MYKEIPSKPNFPKQEEGILKFWKENKIFEKSIDQRSKDNPYSFYDGPPFVTGLPHYAHLLGSIAKDIVPRFQTMRGKSIRRVWGWDCHGLPIEEKVEKKLGLKKRRDIEQMGVNDFIKACRTYVSETSAEWNWYIEHAARWVDMDNAYRTMDLKYMESVIWVFKQLYDKGLIYKDIKTLLFCPRCGTPVSKFEIAMDNSYAEMEDPAVIVKLKVKSEKLKACLAPHGAGVKSLPTVALAKESQKPASPSGGSIVRSGADSSETKSYELPAKSYLLAWTTTPWTLPSNRALVVDENEDYVLVKVENDAGNYILAEKRLEDIFSNRSYQIVDKFKGKDIVGLEYEPLYTFFPSNGNDFKVYSYKNMVNMDEGTGIVHSAPGFGEIDTEMGKHHDLTLMFSVDDEGKFVPEVKKWAGVYVKDADPLIIQDLQERNLMFKSERITHRYPYCYRCETPLIQKAQEAWFVNIQKIKKRMIELNEEINWVPEHFKHGRFKYTMEEAPDWCISRTRYWATVMPVWECEKCGASKVVGSIKEIEELGGEKVSDLHRTGVDHITFKCEQCGGEMRRIPEVLDCWMESGSMPYAERHYPFENQSAFEKSFPADFIVEYVAQVRTWFYYLHALSTALFNSHCFRNVVVTGVMAGTDGRKMSKTYGNYPDPKKALQKYGGDALRLYLMGNPVMMGKDVNMTRGEEIEEKIKTTLLILWNSYRYFITYANIHDLSAIQLCSYVAMQQVSKKDRDKQSHSHIVTWLHSLQILDRWIISRLHQFILDFEKNMEAYDIPAAVNSIQPMVSDLSTWYIRRSRDRFAKGEIAAFQTLCYVLKQLVIASAPAIPFVTEEIYQNIRLDNEPESVHLCDWPEIDESSIDSKLIEQMALVRQITERGHAARREAGIAVKQPLSKILVKYDLSEQLSKELTHLIQEELNVKEVETQNLASLQLGKSGGQQLFVELDTTLTDELIIEGLARELRRKIQDLRKKAGYARDDTITIYWQSDSERIKQAFEVHAEELKEQVLGERIINERSDGVNVSDDLELQGESVWVGVKKYKGVGDLVIR